MAKPEAIVHRSIDGLGKKVDVRRFVRALRVGGEVECSALSQAGLLGDLTVLDARLALGPTGSAKATEVVEAVLEAGFPHKAVRLQLLAGELLPALREGATS